MSDSFTDFFIENDEKHFESYYQGYLGNFLLQSEIEFEIEYFSNEMMSISKDLEELNKEYFKTNELIEKYNLMCSKEGFTDGLKRVGETIIDGIIKFFKLLAEFLRRFINWVANLIKNKIYLKIIHLINTASKDNEKFSEAYDRFGNSNIFEKFDDIPPLREATLKDIYFMKYDVSSFSYEINRIGETATAAIVSIKNALMKTLDNKIFLRNGGAQYGYGDQEKIVLAENRGLLSFYHEKAFLDFIYKIDKIAHTNLAGFIKERDSGRGRGLYSTFNTDEYSGRNLAMAVILNKKLNEVINIQQVKLHKVVGYIKIEDLITKDLLLKIRNKDRTIIDQIEKNANVSLEGCKMIEELSLKFYSTLTAMNEQFKQNNKFPNENFGSIKEPQIWMKVMVDFSQSFFNNRLNMLDVARRATLILSKIAHMPSENSKSISINSILRNIETLDKKQFEKLTDMQLYLISKNFLTQQLRKFGKSINVPVFLVIVKGDKGQNFINKNEDVVGNCIGLYSGIDNNLVKRIINSCSLQIIDGNRINKDVNDYENLIVNEQYKTPDEECKLVGIVIRMYLNSEAWDVYNNKYEYSSIYMPTYYFGIIVHEATHALQIVDYETTLKNLIDINMDIKDADEKNLIIQENNKYGRPKTIEDNEDNIKKRDLIKRIHNELRYTNTSYELEANNNTYEFIMSIVDKTCNNSQIKKYIKDSLVENNIKPFS
jgi:hypothetical protein